MAKVEHNPFKDAVYGFKNSAYTFDLLGRNKYGEEYKLDEKKSPRDSFFALIEQWAFSLPTKSQWLLYIGDIPPIVGDDLLRDMDMYYDNRHSRMQKSLDALNIQLGNAAGVGATPLESLFSVKKQRKNLLDKAKERIEEIGSAIKNIRGIFSNGLKFGARRNPSSVFGCRFADEVASLPGEELSYSMGNRHQGMGGFMGAYHSTDARKAYPPLEISFKETNTSFVDFLIRPWVKVLSFTGLIAQASPQQKVTTTLYLIQYARNVNGNASVPHKQWIFYNCAPISVDGDSLNYSGDESAWPVKKTKWVYTHYSLINYHGYNEVIKYQLPKNPSYFERFIPGSISKTIDTVMGDGFTQDSVRDNLPF